MADQGATRAPAGLAAAVATLPVRTALALPGRHTPAAADKPGARLARITPVNPPHARRRPHTPMRPTYRCRTCAAHWPCPTARLVLTRLYRDDPDGLRRHLTAHLRHARRDLAETAPGVDADALSERFLGWLPPDDAGRPDGTAIADP